MRATARFAACLVVLALGSCAPEAPSPLDPGGRGASLVLPLWWAMLAAGTIVLLVVVTFLLVGLRRSSRRDRPEMRPAWEQRVILAGGVILPLVILVPLTAFSAWTMTRKDLPAEQDGLTVEVTGHRFWWEVRYPQHGIVTANEIHVPAGRTVELHLDSADVIHSFWVPRVHGKLDMVPGKTNTLRIEVAEPGTYLGACAEFCGIQHANMRFHVVAHTEDDFAAWARREAAPAAEPADEQATRGLEVFLGTTCVACHAIRGTPADARVGPDLSHFASRETIAAGTAPNRPGYLGGWIADPQSMKPGTPMPPTSLEPQELLDLLHYLGTLR